MNLIFVKFTKKYSYTLYYLNSI